MKLIPEHFFNISNTSSFTVEATDTSRTENLSKHVPQIAQSFAVTASSQPEAINVSASQPLIQQIASFEILSYSKNFVSTKNTSHNTSPSRHLDKISPIPKLVQQGEKSMKVIC